MTGPVIGPEAQAMSSGPSFVPAEHDEHWGFVLSKALLWHREHLHRLIREWEVYNAAYFEGKLVPPFIGIWQPARRGALGQCAQVGTYGARTEIRIRPSLLTGKHPNISPHAPTEGRALFVGDVLLHECVHEWHQEVTGHREDSYLGHGPQFRDTANRIGEALGLPPVRASRRRGRDADLPSCAFWPYNVRPRGFYLGAWRNFPALEAALRRLITRYGLMRVTSTFIAIEAMIDAEREADT